MDHAAVVAGLVGGQTIFRFQHRHRGHPGFDQSHGRGQADNTAADDPHVIYGPIAHGSLLVNYTC